MDVLVFYDEQAYLQTAAYYQNGLAKALPIYVAFQALGFADALTTAEVPTLFNNPKTLLYNRITDGTPLVFGGNVAVDAQKAYELVQKPAGADALLEKIKAYNSERETVTYVSKAILEPNNFEIVAGNLVVKQALLDQLQEQHRFYAKTDAQKARLTQVQAIVDALNTIRTASTGLGRDFPFDGQFIEKAIRRASNQSLVVNHQYIVSIGGSNQ